MEVLGKLSIATVGSKPKLAASDANNIKTFLMRVMGTASGLKPAIDAAGEPVFGLSGQFLAQDAEGKEYTSGVLYLPGGLQELIQAPLESQLNSADKDVAKSASIQFAMDVFAVPATNKSKYSFQGELLGDAAKADPFAHLKAQFSDKKLPALPSPAEIKAAQDKAPK